MVSALLLICFEMSLILVPRKLWIISEDSVGGIDSEQKLFTEGRVT